MKKSLFIVTMLLGLSSANAASVKLVAGKYNCGMGKCNPTIGQSQDGSLLFMSVSELYYRLADGRTGYCPNGGNYTYTQSKKNPDVFNDGEYRIRVLSRTSLSDGGLVCVLAR
jgi:hypothetical protein